jgi:hypothetical protein
MEVPDKEDHKVYSLKRFIELVLGGDPQLSELLFVPDALVVKITPVGRAVMSLKDAFISNKIYSRVMGYGNSEWRKAMGVQLVIEDRSKEEDDIIAWIRDKKKKWDKERMDTFVGWLNEDKATSLVSTKKDLGEKRKKEFLRFGFGVSSAAHSIRLVDEITELMTTGKITFPRPNADMLRGIRQGKYTKEQVVEIHNEFVARAETTRELSILPDKPNGKHIWTVYQDLVKDFVKKVL